MSTVILDLFCTAKPAVVASACLDPAPRYGLASSRASSRWLYESSELDAWPPANRFHSI